jgi:hypothetical protein
MYNDFHSWGVFFPVSRLPSAAVDVWLGYYDHYDTMLLRTAVTVQFYHVVAMALL